MLDQSTIEMNEELQKSLALLKKKSAQVTRELKELKVQREELASEREQLSSSHVKREAEITEELKRLRAAKMVKLQTSAILGAVILVDLFVLSRIL